MSDGPLAQRLRAAARKTAPSILLEISGCPFAPPGEHFKQVN